MSEHNIISLSGGKDSTALALLAIEREAENLQFVFADTGHEHPQTYDYVRYLDDWFQSKGLPGVRWVRANFDREIAGKAEFVRTKWLDSLTAPVKKQIGTRCVRVPIYADNLEDDDASADPIGHRDIEVPVYGMRPAHTPEQARAAIERALNALKPTGNPFLDLCIWKGRFPSTRARFCSEELKHVPIMEQVHHPIIEAGDDVVSWQGVRADESINRRHLPEIETKRTWPNGASLFNYRPILKWTAEDCFAMHRKHGIKHNPLYEQGMGRVGCMPCIHARKDEILEISKRFPGEFARVAEWERIVSEASKRGSSTFFEADTIPGNSREMEKISHETHGIWSVVEWSKTGRGGVQFDLIRDDTSGAHLCSSIYGLCE